MIKRFTLKKTKHRNVIEIKETPKLSHDVYHPFLPFSAIINYWIYQTETGMTLLKIVIRILQAIDLDSTNMPTHTGWGSTYCRHRSEPYLSRENRVEGKYYIRTHTHPPSAALASVSTNRKASSARLSRGSAFGLSCYRKSR